MLLSFISSCQLTSSRNGAMFPQLSMLHARDAFASFFSMHAEIDMLISQ